MQEILVSKTSTKEVSFRERKRINDASNAYLTSIIGNEIRSFFKRSFKSGI